MSRESGHDGLTRRQLLKGAVAAGGALSAGAGPWAPARGEAPPDTPAPRKPNFVVILCDDLGYGDLGCFGHPAIKTPNLDRLAADGLRLTDCYAAAPVCSPSRAGLLTGRCPIREGIADWIPNHSPIHLKKEAVTVARLLKSAGYATCMAGKWHLSGKMDGSQPTPGDHGFDHWMATQNNAAPSHHNPTNFIRNGQAVGRLEGYSSTLIVDEALRWLKGRKKDQPLFLFVAFHTSHEPVATADEFTRLYPDADNPNRAIYYGNVTQMDHEVGRLLKTLDEPDLARETLVFFTSDNGPEILNRYAGAERSYGSPGPLRGMKLHVYEGGIRVPGILRWTGRAKAGQASDEPVSGVDVLPTLCELAGAKAPDDRPIDGTSVAALLDGKPVTRKTPLYWDYPKAIGGVKAALRDGPWKMLAAPPLDKLELYNLRSDASEKSGVGSSEPARVKAMAETLQRKYNEVRGREPPA
jgi:arylsulfatase A